MRAVRVADVLTHRRPEETADALATLAVLARDAGVTLRLDPEESAKHAELRDDPVVVRGARGPGDRHRRRRLLRARRRRHDPQRAAQPCANGSHPAGAGVRSQLR